MSSPGFAPISAPPAPYGASELTFHVPPSLSITPRADVRDPVDPAVFVNDYTRPLPTYEETFSGPGYEAKPAPTSGFAAAALICGLVGVFTLVPALAAIVLGHLGLWRTSRNSHQGRGLAIGGIVLGYAVVVVVALVALAIWIADR